MSKVNTNSWKEYKLKDLGFSIFHGCRQKKADRKDGSIPLLTAGKENQGVATYIGNPLCKYKDPITVDMFGNCFYHKGTYSGDDNIYFFINENLNDFVKIFIAGIINKQNTALYNFKSQFRQPQADTLSVILPSKTNNQPNWEYMENYIKNIMQEAEKNIEILSKLTINKNFIDIKKWKYFTIGGEAGLFNTYTGGDLILYKTKSGNIPIISHSSENNGIQMKSEKINNRKIFDCKRTISLADRGNFKAFVQDNDFYIGTRVKALELKDSISTPSKYAMFFVATVIDRLSVKFSYKDNATSSLDSQKIPLPVNERDEPDWEYMKSYMKNIMDNCESKLNSLSLSV